MMQIMQSTNFLPFFTYHSGTTISTAEFDKKNKEIAANNAGIEFSRGWEVIFELSKPNWILLSSQSSLCLNFFRCNQHLSGVPFCILFRRCILLNQK